MLKLESSNANSKLLRLPKAPGVVLLATFTKKLRGLVRRKRIELFANKLRLDAAIELNYGPDDAMLDGLYIDPRLLSADMSTLTSDSTKLPVAQACDQYRL